MAFTSGCAGTLSAATADDAQAIAAAPAEAAAAVDWSAPVDARLLMAEFAFAPREIAFVAGRPVRLESRNAGKIAHVFTAPGFFRSIEVHELALLDDTPGPVRRGYDEAYMEELAMRAVGEIVAKTPPPSWVSPKPAPIPSEARRRRRCPSTSATCSATRPVLASAPADAAVAPPAAEPAPAEAPAEAEVALAEPPGAPDAAADAASPAVQPGLGAEAEAALLAEWQADPALDGLRSITVAAGGSAYLTFLPLRPGRYGLSNLRPASAFGMCGTLVILAPGAVPADPEVAVAAADLSLLRLEARPAAADLDLLQNEAVQPPAEAPAP